MIMNSNNRILAHKLSVPVYPNLFISPRLSNLLKKLTQRRLAVVTAGAGHGKTALSAQAIQPADITPVWFRLDEQDKDFSRFIRYVAAGLKPFYKKTCATMDRLIAGTPFSAVHRGRILETLVLSLKNPHGSRVCLVLDDFHTVQEEKAILESIEFLLLNLPPWFHIILLTRTLPGISLSKLKLSGHATELTEADLRFTREETRQFLTGHFKPSLSLALADQLYRITKGWAAGLVLLYLGLKDHGPEQIERLPADIAGSDKLVFNYFEQTIFHCLAPDIQMFMLKTSLLDILEPEVCDGLLRITESKKVLDQLVSGHLLTYRQKIGSDSRVIYTYHQLLRSFLRHRLKQTLSRQDLAGLYRDIARHRQKAGDVFGAVRAYISGVFFNSAAQELVIHENMLFESGRILEIRRILDSFPKQFIHSTPQLLYIRAKLESFCGNPGKAVSLYEIILDRPGPTLLPTFLLNCWIQLGLNYYYTGHIREAEELLENCLTCKDPGKRLEASGLLILIYVILGKIDLADRLARTAREDIRQLPDAARLNMNNWINFILSYRDFVAGDFKTAYAGACRCLDWYAGKDVDIIMPLAYLHAALPAYFLKKSAAGYKWAEKGLTLIRDMGIRDNQEGWLNYAAALHLCGLNRLDQSLDRAQKGLARFKHQSNYWGQAHMYDLIHFIRLKQADPAGAQKALERGLILLRGTGLTMTEGILETGMLSVWLETGRFDAVLENTETVLEKVRASGFYTFKSLMISALCHWHLNDRCTAMAQLNKAIDIALEYGYAHQIADAGTRIEPLLSVLYSKGVRQGFIREIFYMNGRAHCLPQQGVKHPVTPLRISLLGKFCMDLGGQDLNPEAFKNTNALMMIKYLALNHGKGFKHRDEVIELLWPEQDYSKTRKRFNVVVSAIRKFFEPDIRRGAPSRYLKKQGTSFCLALGHGGAVDILNFQDEVQKANKATAMEDIQGAVGHYEAALTLYKGPFLAEDTYTQWCIEQRAKLQEIYLSVLWKLICHCLDGSQPDKGIVYAQKYLETDNSVETVYQKLMQLYAETGNRSQVKKTFESCRQNVFESLDCPPDPETIRLYHACLAVKGADNH